MTRRFGARAVLSDIDWQIVTDTATGLLGSSGAGKTTLLRLLARLDRPTSGELVFGERRERVGMVFQHLGLWPHLTARQHLHFVLSALPRAARRSQAESLLREVQLPISTWDHRPAQLSGGEAQRLALARTLAGEPTLLLLDEPLGQLDAFLRGDLLRLIGDVRQRRELTIVYVSHDPSEVMQVCGRMAVLVDGRLEQEGTCDDVFGRPKSAAVARASGPVVELPRAMFDQANLQSNTGPFDGLLVETGCVLVRPQQVRLSEPHDANRWRVIACRPVGATWRLELSVDNCTISLPFHGRKPVGCEVGLIVDNWDSASDQR